LSAIFFRLCDVRADRLVWLVLLLQARGRMSARSLAAELEVSVRTVYRDVAALNSAGVPVVTEPGRGGGCWLLDGYRFPLRGLSADEASALLLLGVPAAVAELGLADTFAAAHRKIRVTAGRDRPEPAGVHLDMPRWFHGTEPAPHLRTLAEAVRQRRHLRLGYRRDAGAETARVVGPLGLVNKAGTWYLVAFRVDQVPVAADKAAADKAAAGARPADEIDADDLAVFRVGRVTSARVLPSSFTPPADFDLAAFWDHWSDSFVTSLPKIEVQVRASAKALAAFPAVFGDAVRQALDAATPPDGHGFREVTLTFEDEAAAVHRLAGFGGQLEVLSPAPVRARLIATARQLLERYQAD
jgi:predicted DNA-binding transcriptional regulator YafY